MTKMVSTLNLDEKYNRVRRNFCFYLDIQDHGLARSISRRIQDMGLHQEVFLTSRVTHVVRSRAAPCVSGAAATCAAVRRDRADAMPERCPRTVHLSVQKAISLLDKLYDTFFASRKAHVTYFTKHYIKIEFLDKLCRPIYKEFDEWPEISLEPDTPKEKKKETTEIVTHTNLNNKDPPIQKMTRKSRPRIKEREEKEVKNGFCEMCNADYADAGLHRRSPHHLAFVRDHTNFLALDSLIGAGTDVTAFLDKATPINGERRSLRNMCNGDVEQPKSKRSKRSQSPDSTVSTVNGNESPKRNGGLEDERKHNTRCSKRAAETPGEDKHYYKVVGVSTKLRSSGGFMNKPKDSPPSCNGSKPLVVKFRKVRRSELSVLSDEAEQFMFPKRASSSSSTSSDGDDDDDDDDDDNDDDDDDDDDHIQESSRRKSTPPQTTTPATERRRQARPLALKEESSEDDSWLEDKRARKKRPPPVTKRSRKPPFKRQSVEQRKETPEVIEQLVPAEITVPAPEPEVSPLREEPVEKCMKWEDGKLKYTPAVEQLEFAFESVPHSEPWFETFKRQDEDKVLARNVPKYFSLYSKSPKLPYEIGQLPPLKPNCCPLSDLVKREEKPGPSRSYGTRGKKQQKIRNRTAALMALEAHPRKSPREHASTLAILGSAGLLHRRKHADDNKSTASEDTISDIHSNSKLEPVLSEAQEASERLQQFLSEVFEDAAEYDISDEVMDGEAAVATSTNLPDMSSLVSECENCDLIRNEVKEAADRPRNRRGKFKKKNRTGWPNKKKLAKKRSRTNSVDSDHKVDSSLDRSSAEPPDDDTTMGTISEEDANLSETEKEDSTVEKSVDDTEDSQDKTLTEDTETTEPTDESESQEKTLHELKIALKEEKMKAEKEQRLSRSSEVEERKKAAKRALAGLGSWLQPIVRVARVDPLTARRLRSAGRTRNTRAR